MRIGLYFNKYLLASAFPSPSLLILLIFLAGTRASFSFCCSMCRALLLRLARSRRAEGTLPRLFSGNLLWSCYFPGSAQLMCFVCRENKMLKRQLLNGLSETQAWTDCSVVSVRGYLHTRSHGKFWVMAF